MTVNSNNQIISVDIVVLNTTAMVASGVTTTIVIPYGLQYVSHVVPNGVFNPNTYVWTLSQLPSLTARTLTLKLKVVDITKAPFDIKQNVTALENDINLSNNCKTLTIGRQLPCENICVPGTPSNPQVIINNYHYSTVNVNLSQINSVKCGCCISKYTISPILNNFEIDYSDITGVVRGHPIDSTASWSFDYTISCTNCPDGQQFQYGPKTISGDDIITGLDSIIDVTYGDLVSKIVDSSLVAGGKYKITDFATTHYLMSPSSTNGQDLTTILTATVEPIVVTAISANTIDKIAYSSLHPTDIIYYDWNPTNWLTDPGFSDLTLYDYIDKNTATIIPNFKGVIYHREDTLRNNKFGYDFRGVRFRRYKSDPPAWSNITTYALGAAVKFTISGITSLFISLRNTNLNVSPDEVLGSSWWIKTINLTDTQLWAYDSNSYNNVPIDFNTYGDFYTFQELNGFTYENYVENNDLISTYSDVNYSSILRNNVFIVNGNGMYSNRLNISDCTFSDQMTGNDISGYRNIVCKAFSNNIIKAFDHNLIGMNFIENIIETSFSGNIIGDNFQGNTTSVFFYFNFIGSTFGGNITKSPFQNNRVKANFINNYCYNTVSAIDFTLATLVYNNYKKELFNNSSSVLRLGYTNLSDVLTIVNPTT